tara:strand:+ start:402 stop:1382 length:981 start_codon:yes stop_codon:yes gene_type:complete
MAKLQFCEIENARVRIAEHVLRTPLIFSHSLSKKLGVDIALKPEFLQETGSFKIRGATNAMLSLPESKRKFGVATASSGNHGPALAFASTKLKTKSVICLSEMVPKNKIENVLTNGGTVQIKGHDYDSCLEACMDLVRKERLHLVHPFDDPFVIAGAGTIGLELIEDSKRDLDCVLVPLSGGGLLAGVATAIKSLAPHTRIIGVSMEKGASMYGSIKAGKPINVKEVDTIADALGGNIGIDNKWTFQTVQELVDDIVVVEDEIIKKAMREIFYSVGFMIEGAGAVGIAALMSGSISTRGKIACILSGRNIESEKFLNILNKQENFQ